MTSAREEPSQRRILEAYDRLRARPDDWASYLVELEEWADLGAEAIRQSGALASWAGFRSEGR